MSVQPTTSDEGAGDGWTSSRLLRMEDGTASLQSEGMVAEGSAEEQRAATPTRSGSSSRRSSNDSTIQSLSLSGMVCDGDTQSDVSALGTSGHGNNMMEEEAAVHGGGRGAEGRGGGAEATDDDDGTNDGTNSSRGDDGSLPSLIRKMIHNDGGGEDKSRQDDEADQTTPPASGGGSLRGGMRPSRHERSKMHDSGLVTEVRHNYSRGRNQDEGGDRRGSSVEGSIEEEEDDNDDDDEQLLRQEQAQREDDATQSSMTLADLAAHSLSDHPGRGRQEELKKQNSNNTVEEIIETAARARAATLIDVAYGAASAVTTSEGGTEADGISDIGASNSTRDSAAAAYTDYGGTTTTSDLYPAPANATLIQAQTNAAAAATCSGSIPYPNLVNSDPAPNPTPTMLRQESSIGTANSGGSWTQPAHDYMVPLTDGPKRPGRRRSRVMSNKRRGSGTGGGGGGGGGGNGRARSSSRRIANGGAAEAQGTTTGTTGTSSSRADNKTSKRTATTRNSASRTAPVPKTQLTYQESDSTVDSLMDVQIDTNRRSNNNNNNNNSQDSGDLSLGSFATSPSLDPADIIMGLHSSNPSLDGAKVVEKAVRIKDPANTDANQRDRDEANDHQYDDDHDDYSFARSLEPYSREPSLSAHYKDPQDHEEQSHSYMVPLKGQDTSPPTSGNGKEHHPPSRRGSRRAAEGGGGGGRGRRDRGGEARRSLRQRASSTWSTDSIGSILNSMIFGNGDDMTLTGEASRDEQGGLLDAVDAEYDDDDEYIDMQQDDDLEGTYHTQQSWVPSVVMDARSGAQSLDGTTHSRLTMDEGLNARPDEDNHTNGRSRSSSRDRSENKRRFRRAERAEQLRRSRARDEGGDSFDGSQNSFQDSADGMSLLENSRDARDRQGQRGKMKRRPSFDMMDELARKVGDRLMRQQRSRSGSRSRSRSSDDRSRGDYSIALSNRGIPDLHDNEIIDIDDEDYRRSHTGGYTYGYDQRKNSFKIARTGYYSMCQSHKRIVLLVAAAAAIIVGLSVNFGPNNGGITSSDVPIGPGGGGWGGGGIHEVEEEEPLVPSITQALEEELKRRKQLDAEDDSHEQKPEEEGDPDEIFASDGKKKKKKKKGPLRLLVECTRDEGCFEAMQASNFKVHIEDIKNSHMVSVDIDDVDFDKLRELHHVKRIDLDFGIDGIEDVLVDESEIDDEDKDLLRTSEGAVKEGPRTLAQTVPDGAIMVQAVSWDGKTFEETHGPGIAPRKICIADTGACRDHPDIDSQPSHLYGTDMVLDRDRVLPWYPDRNGHGCHLTGLIAGLDNDIGYHGISTATGAVKVFSTRALGDDMSGSLSQMQAAIDQCVSNDADVIVLSLGCTNCYSQSMKEYFDRIAKKNIMVFAAAGNNGAEDYPAKFYPASYPSVISIGAVNKHRGRWYMSNKNDGIEFCAHGYYVYSTDFDLLSDNRFSWNYNPRAGTSMACPQAAAVAAMLWSHFPSCTALDIRAALAHTAKHHAGHTSCNTECGFGIVQLSDAYDFLSDKGCSGVHPILSSSSSTCDCVDSNYQSYSCQRPQRPAHSYSAPQQSSSDQPLCKDNNRAKFTINSRRELLATFGLGGNRNKRRRRKGCAFIRKRKSRAIKWCRQSGKAQQNCKKTCSEKGGISYPDCRPSTQ